MAKGATPFPPLGCLGHIRGQEKNVPIVVESVIWSSIDFDKWGVAASICWAAASEDFPEC